MEYKIFWCKVNKYYTDKWLNSKKLEWKKGIFIASCVVTDNAKRKWIKFVKDTAKKLNEWELIYISWCWAFKEGKVQNDFFDLYHEISSLKNKIVLLDEDPDTEKIVNTTKHLTWILTPSQEQGASIKEKIKKIPQLYTKKFILIQWWCNSFCTYCLTVIKRGKHYSRKKEEILEEIIEFENNWWKEVVLTWINLSAWWLDSTNDVWKSRLAELLEYLLINSKIPRIRISSMWPEFIDDKVLKIFENTRIYPHFHYSIQSWSSDILKSMFRHYDWKYMSELLLKTRNIKRTDWVNISIWADIIVWFPWESEKDFNDSMDLIKKYKITKLHAFPFSAHKLWENVPAWNFPNQINDKIKKNRMWEIMNLSDEIRDNFIDENIWKNLEVLIEVVKINDITWRIKWKWWTQNYIEADQSNFEIISWYIKRNEIVKWILIK